MSCKCSKYPDLPLVRDAITRRIRDTKAIVARLTLLETNSRDRLSLYVCGTCGQHWQTGHEWNFGDRDYIFRVPAIETSEWLREPYCQPASMLIFSAAMKRYYEMNDLAEGDAPCREAGCPSRAMKQGLFCLDHLLEQLRAMKILPPVPAGRLFPPYVHSQGG